MMIRSRIYALVYYLFNEYKLQWSWLLYANFFIIFFEIEMKIDRKTVLIKLHYFLYFAGEYYGNLII